jgi:hypothetical protein
MEDWECKHIFFSTSRESFWDTLLEHREYMGKTTDISVEFAALLANLEEGILPHRTAACSIEAVDKVQDISTNDSAAARNSKVPKRVNSHFMP